MNKKYKFSEAHRKAIGDSKRGKKLPPFTQEHRNKIGSGHRGKVVSEETRAKLRAANLGKKRSEESKAKTTESLKKKYLDGWKPCVGKKASEETRRKMSIIRTGKIHTEEEKRKIGIANKGKKRSPEYCNSVHLRMAKEKHPFWKGGISSLGKEIRNSDRTRKWRDQVFRRDNWTCVWCKARGKVQADHIVEFKVLIEQMKLEQGNDNLFEKAMEYAPLWDLNNGRTLCIPCHKRRHRKNKNK